MSIRGNSIHSNGTLTAVGGLGINLVGGSTENADGQTLNDLPTDADTGANNLMDFPLLTDSPRTDGATTVDGYSGGSTGRPPRPRDHTSTRAPRRAA